MRLTRRGGFTGIGGATSTSIGCWAVNCTGLVVTSSWMELVESPRSMTSAGVWRSFDDDVICAAGGDDDVTRLGSGDVTTDDEHWGDSEAAAAAALVGVEMVVSCTLRPRLFTLRNKIRKNCFQCD